MSVYRAARVLAVLVVASGVVATTIGIAVGVANSEVHYRGKLDHVEILQSFHPTGPNGMGDPLPQIKRGGFQYLSSADGAVTKPDARPGEIAAWGVGELVPWLLAAVALILLWPILRAAERADPFLDSAARRLNLIGRLLLIGIPLYVVYQALVAEFLSGGTGVSPIVSPSLTISVWHFLPGVLVLVIAGVFERGAELREFEQHAI